MSRSSTQPPMDAEAVTPSDSTNIQTFRGINCAGSGYIYVDMESGRANVRHYVSAGSAYPCVGNRIYSTGTTATEITVLR